MSCEEDEFLNSLRVKDLEPYRGKWIAVSGREIIASGEDLHDVCREFIKKTNGKTPFVEHIPASLEETSYVF